jgi:hypothetical protein
MVLTMAAAGFVIVNRGGGPKEARIQLRDRTQMTYTGKVLGPSLSMDGKQLAFFVKNCAGVQCTYSIQVQDVGSTTTHEIFTGATAFFWLTWSEDRRNLLANMTYNGRYGSYLVSMLGGAPRFLGSGDASFFAGGDSLFIGPTGSDSLFVVRIAAVNGGVRDSITVGKRGQELLGVTAIPGTSRFVAMTVQNGRGLWQVIDRNGTVTDELQNSCTCGGAVSHDAIWMQRAGPTAAEAIVRVAIDPVTGKMGKDQDTVYNGTFTGVSVTADGSQMMVDDGSFAFSATAGDVAAILKGSIPEPLLAASSRALTVISPDGQRVLLLRTIPAPNGLTETRLSVAPFGGRAETAVTFPGRMLGVKWADSVSLAIGVEQPGGRRAFLLDVRTNATRQTFDMKDSVVADISPVLDGWAWIPASRDRIVIERGGNRTEIPRPNWFAQLNSVTPSPDGRQLVFSGWGPTQDSIRVEVVSVEGGAPTPWYTVFSEGSAERMLADGSIAIMNSTGPETAELIQVTAPGQAKRLGTIPHAITRMSVSNDLKRMSMMWRDYRGDAWLYKVVRP